MSSLRECVGGVPLIVRLASEDIVHPSEKPAPIAFVLPRTTLLIAVLKDLLQMFAPYAVALNKFNTQVWFSFDDLPIPWIYPVGAIKDYITELRRLKTDDIDVNLAANEHSIEQYAGKNKCKDESTRLQMLLTLAAQPVELHFHIHPQSRNSIVERVIPAVIDYDHLDAFIRNEVRQWHKATYTALYGTYKYYHNLMEAILLPVLAMALYRPFDTQEPQPLLAFMKMNSVAPAKTTLPQQTQVQQNEKNIAEIKELNENRNAQKSSITLSSPLTTSESTTLPSSTTTATSTLSAQETSKNQPNALYGTDSSLISSTINTSLQPELTSPYLLTEYQHILQEKLSRPHVSFILSIAIPIVQHCTNEVDATYERQPLTFQLCRVSAAPMERINLEQQQHKEQEQFSFTNNNKNNDDDNNKNKDNGENTQSENQLKRTESISEENQQEEASHHLELDTIPLGLLIWRAFRILYFHWLRSKNECEKCKESEQATPITKNESKDSKRSYSNGSNFNCHDTCSSTQRDLLFAALSFCYEGAPEGVMEADQEGLRTTLPTKAERWASWEFKMVHRLIHMYDTHGIYVRGISESRDKYGGKTRNTTCETHSTFTTHIANNTTQGQYDNRRIYFEVQGTQPPLCTPASFIESNFTSSDRSIYITVQVY